MDVHLVDEFVSKHEKNIAKSPILRFWAYISFLYLSEVKYAPRNETVGTSVVRIRHISLWPVKLIST